MTKPRLGDLRTRLEGLRPTWLAVLTAYFDAETFDLLEQLSGESVQLTRLLLGENGGSRSAWRAAQQFATKAGARRDVRVARASWGLMHAKLVLAESARVRTAIIGSSNFTNGGMERNLELNCLIEAPVSERSSVHQLRAVFDELFARSTKPDPSTWTRLIKAAPASNPEPPPLQQNPSRGISQNVAGPIVRSRGHGRGQRNQLVGPRPGHPLTEKQYRDRLAALGSTYSGAAKDWETWAGSHGLEVRYNPNSWAQEIRRPSNGEYKALAGIRANGTIMVGVRWLSFHLPQHGRRLKAALRTIPGMLNTLDGLPTYDLADMRGRDRQRLRRTLLQVVEDARVQP